MNLIHYHLQSPLDFSINQTQLLVVENSNEFFNLSSDLIGQTRGQEGKFALFNECEEISIEKNVLIVHNFFDLDCNTKRIENALNCEILNWIREKDYFQIIQEINLKIGEFNERIKNELDFELTFDDDITPEDILKISKFKIDHESGILSKLHSFVEINLKIKKFKLLVLVNAMTVFNKEEIKLLIKEFRYMQINVLLVENNLKYDFDDVKKTIIDNDLCVI